MHEKTLSLVRATADPNYWAEFEMNCRFSPKNSLSRTKNIHPPVFSRDIFRYIDFESDIIEDVLEIVVPMLSENVDSLISR